MELLPEWNEFLGALKRHGVRFLLIGAHALAAHGRPRFTQDLDVLVEPAPANARRVAAAIAEFGFVETARDWRWFAKPYRITMIGRMPMRIDVLTSISGVSFRTAWRNRIVVSTTLGDVPVLGLAELRANKLASGRPKDVADPALLDELVLAIALHLSGAARVQLRGDGVRPSVRGPLLELEAAFEAGALDQRGRGAAGRVLDALVGGVTAGWSASRFLVGNRARHRLEGCVYSRRMAMTRVFASLVLVALCLTLSKPASAAFGDVTLYDSVDEIKVRDTRITVTGIVAGQSAPSTTTYVILNSQGSTGTGATDVAASRCDRLALLAMSKPGKFQFGVVQEDSFATRFSCKLIVRTP